MISSIGVIILLVAGINFAWILLWYVISLSGNAGAKLSKKIDTDNTNTDNYIEQGASFSKELKMKLLWRFVLMIAGYMIYVYF